MYEIFICSGRSFMAKSPFLYSNINLQNNRNLSLSNDIPEISFSITSFRFLSVLSSDLLILCKRELFLIFFFFYDHALPLYNYNFTNITNTRFFNKNTVHKNIEAQIRWKNKNKLRPKWSWDYVQWEIKIYITKAARCFL